MDKVVVLSKRRAWVNLKKRLDMNCDHDWKIWPETDGQDQRCMKCKQFRKPPEAGEADAILAAVASWMMSRGYATGHGDSLDDLLSELVWQTRLKSIAPLYRYDPSTSAFVMFDGVYQTMK